MPCTQSIVSIDSSCDRGQGGIIEVYVANLADIDKITENTGKVTAISLTGDAKFKVFKCNSQTPNATSNGTNDEANGVINVQTDLALVFGKMDSDKRTAFESLVRATSIVIYKDSNGNCWLVGEENGCIATSFGAETGSARTDRNAYTCTLSAQASHTPLFVEASVIATIL